VTSEWNFFDFASKDNMLGNIRRQSDDVIQLASEPGRWEAPTAAGHWEVRDVVGHLVDTTEGYFASFDAGHGRAPAADALGVKGMNEHVDRGALALRTTSQDELLLRLAKDRDEMLAILGGLDAETWSGFLAPHKYMGPVPACVYAAGQLVDYAVHGWDIRQGTGRAHALDGEAADLLVPFAFIVWQSTAVCDGVEAFDIGVRLSGVNGGDTRISVRPEGVALEPAPVSDLPCVLEFDPASFVLTVFGRVNAGTVRGDAELAERFANLFFRI
jgi:uncharacterized protein (TIGR03083 family)